LADRLPLAVVGAGRAGQARVRALGESPDARLVALVSHREPEGPLFASVLANASIAGVILCTPNLLHAPQARAALEAGKHVLVEFPLASGPAEARALFAQARESGLVLHEEHIELISPSQQALRVRARELGPPRGGTLAFSGALEGWIGDPSLAGSPALCAVARLHRLVDLFGDAEVRSASLTRGPGYRLEVELSFERGGATRLVEERAPGAARGTHWQVECEHGLLGDPAAERPAGLFAQDLACFVARVTRNAEPYLSEARCLHVFDLVEAIERRLC
jgi:predicted dehydrogenase